MAEEVTKKAQENTEETVEKKVKKETFKDILKEALDEPGASKVPLDVREISLDEIAERSNVRPAYHGIEGLAETMHLQGQLQPCVVRPSPQDSEHGRPFEIVCGHRRRRAAEFLREKGIEGWDTLRCEVRDIPDDNRIRQTIVENFQREDLSPVAEARAMQELKYSNDPPLSNLDVAKALGCDPSHVSHRLKILELAPKPVVKPAPVVENEDKVVETIEPSGDDNSADSTENVDVKEEIVEEEVEKPKVDILEMVDKGEISASTAEVIASLEERTQQEKLATLAKRGQWSTKKAASWARDVKENQATEDTEKLGPVDIITIEDVVEMMHLHPRSDITDQEIERILCYAMLRNGMDREILDYLEEKMNIPYEELWDYIASLKQEDVHEFNRRLALRYIAAAHRWFSLEPSLKETLGAPEQDSDAAIQAAADELAANPPGAGDMSEAPQRQDPAETLQNLLEDDSE